MRMRNCVNYDVLLCFTNDSVSRESKCNAGDTGDVSSVPGLGRSPGRGTDGPLQCSCLENPMHRGAWWPTAHRATKELDVTKHTHIFCYEAILFIS